MKLLLDTHALLWWVSDSQSLGDAAREAIADPGNDVMVSVVSIWEVVIKTRIGKLRVDVDGLAAEITAQGFAMLEIRPAHLATLAGLPQYHRDPFDHMLVAQALAERAALMSADRKLRAYPGQHMAC